METEKMIEEMARDTCNRYSKVTDRCRIDHQGCNYLCGYYDNAKTLYDLGYRKIPEGAVVLTEDNAEDIANMIINSPQAKETMDGLIKAWQKETAREILNKVDYESNGQTKQITDLLRRKYGVEVE